MTAPIERLKRETFAIPIIKDRKEANVAVSAMKSTEDVLRAAEELENRLEEFVLYEAAVMDEIARGGFETQIDKPTARWACRRWAFSTSEERGSLVREAIGRGVTLRYLLNATRRDERASEQGKAMVEAYKKAEKEVLRRLDETGFVDISAVFAGAEDTLNRMMRDECKDKLLKHGAVGVGNGVYVNPEKNPREAINAIHIRICSIANDIGAVRMLYSMIAPSLENADRKALIAEAPWLSEGEAP